MCSERGSCFWSCAVACVYAGSPPPPSPYTRQKCLTNATHYCLIEPRGAPRSAKSATPSRGQGVQYAVLDHA